MATEDVVVRTPKTHQAEAALVQWADAPVHDRSGREVFVRVRTA